MKLRTFSEEEPYKGRKTPGCYQKVCASSGTGHTGALPLWALLLFSYFETVNDEMILLGVKTEMFAQPCLVRGACPPHTQDTPVSSVRLSDRMHPCPESWEPPRIPLECPPACDLNPESGDWMS